MRPLGVVMRAITIKALVVGFFHCAAGLLLYRGRVVDHFPVLQSDFLVFLLPALIALIAYGVVFWSSGFLRAKPALRLVVTSGASLLASCLSSGLLTLVAFNRYGT